MLRRQDGRPRLDHCRHLEVHRKAPFGLPHIRFVRLLFSAGTVFSLTTIQPEQCFSASFSQNSASRTGRALSLYLIISIIYAQKLCKSRLRRYVEARIIP